METKVTKEMEFTAGSRIVREKKEKRSRFVKYFETADKGCAAVVYPDAVHFEENGEWKEIDHTLVEDERGGFANRAADMKVRFAKEAGKEPLVEVKKDGYVLSWDVVNEKKSGKFEKLAVKMEAEADEKDDIRAFNLKKMVHRGHCSGGTYHEVCPGVDLEYRLQGENLKENIFLNTKAALGTRVVFRLSHKGLEAVREKDGSILLCPEGKPEKAVFYLDAPYMYDAAGAMSAAVQYQVEPVEEGSLLTVVPDRVWMESSERVLLVVVPPHLTVRRQVSEGIPRNASHLPSFLS